MKRNDLKNTQGIETVATDFYRILSAKGSICWQVGNHVDKEKYIPRYFNLRYF